MYESKSLAIIADDLSGALDSAVAFCQENQPVAVACAPEKIVSALKEQAPVVAVTTRSRESSPVEARQAVATVLEHLSGYRLFKKIDSRMKGNIAQELDAFPDLPLYVLPAIPEFGRRVERGQVVGFGVDKPIDIAVTLGQHAARAIIPDCCNADDMRLVIDQLPENALIVGARSAAQALALSMKIKQIQPLGLSGRVAMAIGSTDPITLAQIDFLKANRTIQYFAAPSGVLKEVPKSALKCSEVRLLQAVPGESADSVTVALNLARSFFAICQPAESFVLSGGATAEIVLESLGIGVLLLEGELLPGLPVSRAGQWRVVTKSGGFGDRDTLVRLMDLNG